MAKIRIKIGELFEKLGITDTPDVETTHDIPCDIYVRTPEEELAKINFLVTKTADCSDYEIDNGSILKVADQHIVMENGQETQIQWAKSVDNIDGNSYQVLGSTNYRTEKVYDFGIDAPHLYTTPDGSIHHNTTIASIIFLYDLARLLCMDEPQIKFKLPKSAKIFFTLTNSTMENIEQVNYDPVMALVRESPFFRSKFNNTKSRTSLFINNIDINMVSRKHALVGKNVYSASSDEVNQEIQKGGSQNIVTEMYNRINSRFLLKGNKWAGHYSMISSATTEGSLIQSMIDNANENSETTDEPEFKKSDILVISAPRFEILAHKIEYSGKEFQVFIGDYQSDPFFVETPQDLARANAYDPTKVFSVPFEYRGEFDDIYAGIRDVLGMAVSDVRTFIPFKEKIKQSLILHGSCQRDEIILAENADLMDFFDKDKIDMFKPGSQKVIGLDIAYSGDRYGLSMIHIHDGKGAGEGELKEFEYWVDFAVGIKPPKGEKLKLYQIREFIFALQDMGIHIEFVVSDSFQSTDTLQLIEKQGIKTKTHSVDRKKDAYVALRNAIIDERIKLPHNQILYRELIYLKEDEKKVDHPEHNQDGTPGSKDIADAVANALWIISTEVEYKPYLDKEFIDELEEVVGDDWDEDNPFGDIFGAGTTGNFIDR